MAAPVIAATATSASESATSHIVSLPSGIVSGNRLVARFSSKAGADNAGFPLGWNKVFSVGVGGTTDAGLDCYYRDADGTEGASITVTTPGATDSAHIVDRITGHAATAPQAGIAASGTSANPDPPNLAPSWGAADTLWLGCISVKNDISVSAYPSNYTYVQTSKGSVAPSAVHCASAARQLNASAEDPGTFTISASNPWWANTVAIRPLVSYSVAAAAGSYGITGTAAGLEHGSLVGAGSGSYSITGTVAGLRKDVSIIAAAPGSYSVSGASASLEYGRLPLAAAGGAYSISGAVANLERHLPILAAAGAYAITGTATGLRKDSVLAAAAASYSITGVAANLEKSYLVAALPGAYVLTGTAAGLIGEFRLADFGNWSGARGAGDQETRQRMSAPLSFTRYF